METSAPQAPTRPLCKEAQTPLGKEAQAPLGKEAQTPTPGWGSRRSGRHVQALCPRLPITVAEAARARGGNEPEPAPAPPASCICSRHPITEAVVEVA